MKAIIVKLGSGMNAKCDNDAVLSGDMIRAFLQLDVLLRPMGKIRPSYSEFEGNKHAIRLNPGYKRVLLNAWVKPHCRCAFSALRAGLSRPLAVPLTRLAGDKPLHCTIQWAL
ncbi:hypothetical protein [Paraburkholderia diazotrophica]|uniref:hypothetical protein n=1 Tax=Paraburkholderia diazotrophica TaxID=667676 RepID=UPI0031773E3C